MKKYIILAVVALAASAACTKVEVAQEAQREISFEVANRMTKANVKYENGDFGTYAWFNNTDPFMVNEKVGLVSGVWKTVDHTFYWPKTGSISFISYSPYSGPTPVVEKDKITYPSYTVADVDVMYADRATCSSNVDEVNDGVDSGYTGVPTVFRHALAQLSFDIKANFLEYDDPVNHSHTEWEVTVTSAKISGFKNTGKLELNIDTDGKTWKKPEETVGTEKVNVWQNVTGATAEQELVDAATYPSGVALTTTAQALNAADGFVMPQVLTAGAQKLKLVIHIKTKLSNGLTIEEDLDPELNLSDISTLKAWQMNEKIHYTINIKPTSSDASNPHNDDPDDVVITFDPAVADWTNVDASATIQL